MAIITWDSLGERFFETGVFNCVLYNESGQGVAWNGITAIKESVSLPIDDLYFDGKAIEPYIAEEDFSATITAVTYPDFFLECIGDATLYPGVVYNNQAPKRFHLSYKTKLGTDIDGIDHGYKIHILYNLTAKPSSLDASTTSETISISDFSWDVNSSPELMDKNRPTSHVIIDSTTIKPDILEYIESVLYGTNTLDAELPPLSEFVNNINEWGLIIITDNGDGTWTASGPDEYFSMIDETTFQITGLDGSYSDPDTYTITSTMPD